MKIVSYEQLMEIKGPVVFSLIDPEEEQVSELYFKVPNYELKMGDRSIPLISLGVSNGQSSGIDNYYTLLNEYEELDEEERTPMAWEENVNNLEQVSHLCMTSDDLMFLLYSKQDIQNMTAALAGIWKDMPE